MSEDLQRRTCRACGQNYDYPGHQSLATRSYCENCVQLPEPARRNFERMRRRIERLEKALADLKNTDARGQ
jgi:hypothetical protein